MARFPAVLALVTGLLAACGGKGAPGPAPLDVVILADPGRGDAGGDAAASPDDDADPGNGDPPGPDGAAPADVAEDLPPPDAPVDLPSFDAAPDTAPDAAPDVPFQPTCEAAVAVQSPGADEFLRAGAPFEARATLSTPGDPTLLVIRWETATGLPLATSAVDAAGTSTATIPGMPAVAGGLVARAANADGPCAGEPGRQPLSVCRWLLTGAFDAPDPAAWKVLGDASWDPGGWIEMTGNTAQRQGAIYNPVDPVAGAVETLASSRISWRFRFAAGGGGNPVGGAGGDGMAATLLDVRTAADLEAALAQAASGGGLGYGLSGAYGSYAGKALTVEVDTWHNDTSTSGDEKHTDPGWGPHVAVTLDADPGNHVVSLATPAIQDLLWHDLRVDVAGTTVRVFLDGNPSIDTTVPGLDFRGGYLFFSGSTGWAWEYHRFDDVSILHGCL